MGDRMTLFAMTERAMSAQLVRMNAATSNLANAGSVAGSEEEAYRPIRPVFRAELDRASGLTSVRSDGLVESQTAPTKRYDPGNPLADESGHVFEAPVDETRDVAGRDRAVAHAPPRCLHLDERFEPQQTSRSIAHDLDVDSSDATLILHRAGYLIRADGASGAVARHVDASHASTDCA